jgi:predicted aspartyl protease
MGSARCVLALLFGLAAPSAHAAECARERLASVATTPLPDGRITVPVTVEGRTLSMLVDTGGVSTTVKWESARDLKLPVKQTTRNLQGVDGSVLNFALTGENVLVGARKVKNKPIYVEQRPLPFADGTLSSDILRDYEVEIDMAAGQLSLLTPGYCAAPGATAVAMDVTQSGHVRFAVKIDGKTVMATLDTGSTISLIGMQAARQLSVYPGDLTLVRDMGRHRLYTYPFQTLELGGVTVKNPNIAIASDGFLPEMDDLVLGIDALAGLKLTIAYGQNRLYISGAPGN